MITEVSQLNSWAFTWKQIKVIIFSVLFGNILIKILLTKLGRSEWEPSWSHALVQTSLRPVCIGELDSTKISHRFAMI